MTDLINNPEHYKSASAIGRRILRSVKLDKDNAHIDAGHCRMLLGTKLDLDGECIDAIESSEYFQNYHAGNVIKYVWRAGAKDDIKKDLGKARWYADRYLGFYRSDPLMIGLRDAIEVELLAIG